MNKIVLITGTSTGIGKLTAIALAQAGCRVFAGIRNETDKNNIEKEHHNIKGIFIDVTDVKSIENAYAEIEKQTNKIDVLINNAGIVAASPIELIDLDFLKEQFNVNTFGAILMVQKFLPLLSNGRIINISSMASSGLFPYISPYCASKRALDILMNSFFLENKNNIKVISIKPASIKTPIWDKSIKRCEGAFLNTDKNKKYQKEYEYLKQNAILSSKKGLDAKIVVDTIIKVINVKNPKPSYNVGFSAKLADILSKFPQSVINKIIKIKLKHI